MPWEEQFGYSQAVKAGDTIYLSGQVSHDDEGDIIGIGDMEVQMCQAYANIHKVLAQYGSTIDDLVEEHVFVTDMEAAFAAAVKIMREVFSGFPTVASTIVQIQRLAFPELIGMAPNLEMLFLLELLLVALVFILMVAGAVYIAIHDRRIRRKIGRQVGTADIAVGATSQERASVTAQGPAPHQPPRREFYERTGLQRGVQMKMRLYSINDYESELKGDGDAFGRNGYVAALKGYMILEDEWLDCSLRKAAGLLHSKPKTLPISPLPHESKSVSEAKSPHCVRSGTSAFR